MDLILQRRECKDTGIFSDILDKKGNVLFATCEHSYEDGQGGWKPKIPDGDHLCELRDSQHFGYKLFGVSNTPGCTDIEIHRGNTEKDSHGCILLGMARVGDAVVESKKAFEDFMSRQEYNSFTLTVKSL